MKIKTDFVTNSSSTSYIMSVEFSLYDQLEEIELQQFKINNLRDLPMKEIIIIIENTISSSEKILFEYYDVDLSKEKFKLILNTSVEEFCCDGWDGGDYYFSGNGGAFYGISELTKMIMTKTNVELMYNCANKKIEGYPEIWNHQGDEWLEEIVKDKGIEKAAEITEMSKEDFIKYLYSHDTDPKGDS